VIVALGMLAAKRLDGLTAVFLATTVLTSLTGFFFPYEGFKPSYVVGVLSLIVLAIAIFGRYSRHLAGGWRPDLRNHIGDCALPERFCLGRAAFREGAGVEGYGARTVRTPV
jgi:hypothetical protein